MSDEHPTRIQIFVSALEEKNRQGSYPTSDELALYSGIPRSSLTSIAAEARKGYSRKTGLFPVCLPDDDGRERWHLTSNPVSEEASANLKRWGGRRLPHLITGLDNYHYAMELRLAGLDKRTREGKEATMQETYARHALEILSLAG